jgi:hypothetical protein
MAEAKYLVYFSYRLGYLKRKEHSELRDGYDKLGKSLWKFYETVSGKGTS